MSLKDGNPSGLWFKNLIIITNFVDLVQIYYNVARKKNCATGKINKFSLFFWLFKSLLNWYQCYIFDSSHVSNNEDTYVIDMQYDKILRLVIHNLLKKPQNSYWICFKPIELMLTKSYLFLIRMTSNVLIFKSTKVQYVASHHIWHV